jgi:hypothetical protein
MARAISDGAFHDSTNQLQSNKMLLAAPIQKDNAAAKFPNSNGNTIKKSMP